MERKLLIRIAVVGSDPVRLSGYRALFGSESSIEVVSASLLEVGRLQGIDLVLLSICKVKYLLDLMAGLKTAHPGLRIIVTGSGNENTILRAVVARAKGYVDEAASPPAEVLHAAQTVIRGLI